MHAYLFVIHAYVGVYICIHTLVNIHYILYIVYHIYLYNDNTVLIFRIYFTYFWGIILWLVVYGAITVN